MKNPKITPRPYQTECLEAIFKAIASGENRALVVMASGLGKTLTSAFAIRNYFKDRDFGRVLVLCHSEVILSQSKDKLKEYFGDEYSYGMYTSSNKTAHRTDFLFATFQTMKERRTEFEKDAFNYIVVDEAHHSHAHTYFPTIRYFKPEFLLGLTATPDRLDGQNIEEIYGTPVYELDFVEATNRGLLAECDYQLVLDDMSQEKLDECLESKDKLSISQLNRTVFMPKRDEEIVRLINKYSAEQQDPKTMIFCRSIEHARRIAKIMGEDAVLVHRNQSKLANNLAIDAFRQGKVHAIVSVQMLNEGVDVPDANIIVFLRNTVSKTVFYQQLGRGTRLSPGKYKVKVLDFVANCERIQTVLELKQGIDDLHPPIAGDNEAHYGPNSHERFTLNIATPEFKKRTVDIIKMLQNLQVRRPRSQEELIISLQTLSGQLGRSPFVSDVGKNNLPVWSTYAKAFGSWNDALRAAGLEINVNRGYTPERLIQDIRDLAEDLGRVPTRRDCKAKEDTASQKVYTKVFGSWNKALEAAGLVVNRRTEFITDQELLEHLSRYIEQLGHIPTSQEYMTATNAKYNLFRYLKRFGSWRNAIEQAMPNVKCTGKGYTLTDEELSQSLRDFTIKLGRLPKRKEVAQNQEMASPATYQRHFGGKWKEILQATGAIDALNS